MNIDAVYAKHEKRLLKSANVTGVGIGEKNGKEAIIVFVTHKVPESELQPGDLIPKILDGFETDVKVQISVGQ